MEEVYATDSTRKRRDHPPGGPLRAKGVNKTLKELGLHKSTFYKWYRAYLQKGKEGLTAKRSTRQQWNIIPEEQRQLVVEIALEHPALSPRELAVKITDEQKIFISESSVYRILKGQGLITTPQHILLSASTEFKVSLALSTSCGREILRTLKSWGGVGTTSRLSSMITVALLSTGNSVRPCVLKMCSELLKQRC